MTFLKKDVFDEVIRFRKVAYFLIEWMPFVKTDIRSKDVRFLKRHPLIWNSLVQVDIETRPIECGNQQIINTILFQNKHKILTHFLIRHKFYFLWPTFLSFIIWFTCFFVLLIDLYSVLIHIPFPWTLLWRLLLSRSFMSTTKHQQMNCTIRVVEMLFGGNQCGLSTHWIQVRSWYVTRESVCDNSYSTLARRRELQLNPRILV